MIGEFQSINVVQNCLNGFVVSVSILCSAESHIRFTEALQDRYYDFEFSVSVLAAGSLEMAEFTVKCDGTYELIDVLQIIRNLDEG